MLIFILILLLSEGQAGETWEPSQTGSFLIGNRREWLSKVFPVLVLQSIAAHRLLYWHPDIAKYYSTQTAVLAS
jgi:hypothetical protein